MAPGRHATDARARQPTAGNSIGSQRMHEADFFQLSGATAIALLAGFYGLTFLM